MAVDVSEPFISPRISFSYDLNNQPTDTTTTTTAAGATVVTTTFDFCITLDLLQQITSADELFYDGVILPTQIKKPEKPKILVSENEDMHIRRKRLKELLSDNDEEHKQEKASSFWKFARSTSFNADNGGGSKRFFRSLSLKRLLRSNSTDSALNPKGNDAPPAVMEKLNSGNEPAKLPRCSSSIQTAPIHYGCRGDKSWRRSVMKNSGDVIKVNPILNIPPAYNMNLVGSGSLFCKPKNRTK